MIKMSCVWQTKINTCLNSLGATFFSLSKTEGSVWVCARHVAFHKASSSSSCTPQQAQDWRACTHKVLVCAQLPEAVVNYTRLEHGKTKKGQLKQPTWYMFASTPDPIPRTSTAPEKSKQYASWTLKGIGNKARHICTEWLYITGASHLLTETALQSVCSRPIVLVRLSRDLTHNAKSDTWT